MEPNKYYAAVYYSSLYNCLIIFALFTNGEGKFENHNQKIVRSTKSFNDYSEVYRWLGSIGLTDLIYNERVAELPIWEPNI